MYHSHDLSQCKWLGWNLATANTNHIYSNVHHGIHRFIVYRFTSLSHMKSGQRFSNDTLLEA